VLEHCISSQTDPHRHTLTSALARSNERWGAGHPALPQVTG
jgi:hypothetical protein